MPTTAVSLTDVRVPAEALLGAEGQGFVVAMNAMDYGRLTRRGPVGGARAGVPGRRAGVRRRAHGVRREDRQLPDGQEAARRHDRRGRGRTSPGRAGGRERYDAGDLATRECSIAKYYAGEVCNRAAQATAEIFGGAAFSDDLPIGLYLNFAKLWQTGEGSANIQAVLIADDALGWKKMDRHRTVLTDLRDTVDRRMSDVEVEERGTALWITAEPAGATQRVRRRMAAAIIEALEEASTVPRGRHHRLRRRVLRRRSADQPQRSPTCRRCGRSTGLRCGCSTRIRTCPRPVIAAVNGAAAGGGNELVVACDLAIAARSATFGQTGPRVGSSPVTGATNVMGVQIGEKRAKELSMLCRRYSAERPSRWAWSTRSSTTTRSRRRSRRGCDELAALSPRYLEITKISSNLWWNAARDSFSTGLGMLVQAIGSDDMVEGAASFMEKRKPQFPDPA